MALEIGTRSVCIHLCERFIINMTSFCCRYKWGMQKSSKYTSTELVRIISHRSSPLHYAVTKISLMWIVFRKITMFTWRDGDAVCRKALNTSTKLILHSLCLPHWEDTNVEILSHGIVWCSYQRQPSAP